MASFALILLLCSWGDAFSGVNPHQCGALVGKRYISRLPLASTAAEGDCSFFANGKQVLLPEEQTLTRAEQKKILEDYRVPTVSAVLSFAIPAVGVWICVPLLSIITSSMVGLSAGTAQQAALNPAIAVISYSSKAMVSAARWIFGNTQIGTLSLTRLLADFPLLRNDHDDSCCARKGSS